VYGCVLADGPTQRQLYNICNQLCKKNDAELPKTLSPFSPKYYYKKIPIQDWSGFNKNWQQKKVNEIVIRNSKLKRWVNPSHLCQKKYGGQKMWVCN